MPEWRRGTIRRALYPLAAAVILVVLVVAMNAARRAAGQGRVPVPDTTVADTVPGPAAEYRGARLREGELFAGLAQRLGLDRATSDSAQAALEAAGFEFRTMHAGDSVTLECADSAPRRLTYHLDMANGYTVEFDAGRALARIVSLPVDTFESTIRGAVDGSLWESMTAAGADPQLVATYCEVLRNAVRFPVDVEKGDTFRVVVERLEVGGVFYRFGDILQARYAGQNASGEAYLYRPDSGASFYADAGGRSLHRLLDFPPVEHARRTSDFGPRMHPFRRRRINHAGMDYAAAYGTPVRAVADGAVTKRQWTGGYGRTVDVRHDGSDLSSRYAHLCRYGTGVKAGTRVSRGDVLGFVGATGVSTGFHLDFSVRRDGSPVDPLEVLPSGFRTVPGEDMPRFLERVARWRAS